MIADALRKLELDEVPLATPTGRLVGASGLLLEAVGCKLHTGQRAQIETQSGEWLEAQMVGFRDKTAFLMPYKKAAGLPPAHACCRCRTRSTCRSGPAGWAA